MSKLPLAERLAVVPLSFVLGAVCPDHGALAVAESAEPLPLVGGPVFIRNLFSIRFLVALEAAVQELSLFLVSEVLGRLLRLHYDHIVHPPGLDPTVQRLNLDDLLHIHLVVQIPLLSPHIISIDQNLHIWCLSFTSSSFARRGCL